MKIWEIILLLLGVIVFGILLGFGLAFPATFMWVGIAAAVLLGLIFIAAIIVVFVLRRSSKRRRAAPAVPAAPAASGDAPTKKRSSEARETALMMVTVVAFSAIAIVCLVWIADWHQASAASRTKQPLRQRPPLLDPARIVGKPPTAPPKPPPQTGPKDFTVRASQRLMTEVPKDHEAAIRWRAMSSRPPLPELFIRGEDGVETPFPLGEEITMPAGRVWFRAQGGDVEVTLLISRKAPQPPAPPPTPQPSPKRVEL